MGRLWRVERPGETAPLVMKLPRVREGDDPAAIVGFEVEQMILPWLADGDTVGATNPLPVPEGQGLVCGHRPGI
jgi:hypothetical protein